ncbi:MAG: ATP-binding cassette domain-containing protein [Clostridia bacterium]|nr:ATP-binding cassette domain-containing protein [Clostridia bacterium]
MLELKNVSFEKDNKKILDDINFILEDNSFVVITGKNGSGKSTLAKIIMGIEKPTTGSIVLDNFDITQKEIDERANLGISYAFQQPVKFKGITVENLIKLSAKKKINRKEVCDILSKVGLCANEYSKREVNGQLSGGELKRIEIASVIAKESKIILFDEPEAGIDLWSFNNLINTFKELRKNISGAIVVISHQEKIINIADKVILMNEGKIEKTYNKDSLHEVLASSICCKLQGGAHNG